ARTGAGIGESAPLTDFQIISLKTKSSAASSTSRFSFAEILSPNAPATFFASKSTCAGRFLYGVKSGVGENEAYIGSAAASNWLIGFRFRINSIVRNILLVE